jgi:hypothetical protein
MIGHHLAISDFWNVASASGVCCSRGTTQAIFAPKEMPQDIVTKLNDAVVTALADLEIRSRLAKLGHIDPAILPRRPSESRAPWSSERIRYVGAIIANSIVMGDEAAWWQKHGLDPTTTARALWLKTHPVSNTSTL